MTETQRLNSRGLANGWHAQQLQRNAERSGQTMAEYFSAEIAMAAAYSVPAVATKVRGGYAHYRFNDGSTIRLPHRAKTA